MEKPLVEFSSVSVIIPVKNEKNKIKLCIEGILSQTIDVLEIIAIDSGSIDGTLEILKTYSKVKIIQIDPETFNHGETRNLGISRAIGDLVVLTVSDAIPADNQWLEKMIIHFSDPEVAGVCGKQIVPHQKGINPHEWSRFYSLPETLIYQFKTAEDFYNLSPQTRRNICSWDDVNAMYRKSVMLQIPFRRTVFAEDAYWAQDALGAGHKIIYEQTSQVHHYHYQTRNLTYKRTLTQLYFTYKIFGFIQKSNSSPLDFLKVLYRNFKYRAHPKWIFHNFTILLASKKAFKDFHEAIKKGNEELDLLFKSKCKTIPHGSAGE